MFRNTRRAFWMLMVLLPAAVRGQEWVPLESGSPAYGRVQVRDSSATGLTLAADIRGFVRGSAALPDGRAYDLVQDPGGASGPIGQPDVPSFTQWILVPNGCEVRMETRPGAPVVFSAIRLAPVQPPPSDSGDAAAMARDEEVYARDADYPGAWAAFEAVTEIRGQAARLVRLHPYQYNPRAGVLTVYPRLEVRLEFIGTPARRDPRLASRAFDGVLRGAPNADAVLAAEAAAPSPRGGSAFGGTTNGCELLIITADAFTSAAIQLAEWKMRRGIATTVVTTNETGSATNQVRDYIRNAYTTWSPAPSYVLLLGDSDFIPPWYKTDHPAGERKNSTDLFYADMSATLDWIPDLAIGRWPVETAAQATNWAARVIAYERAPPSRALFGRYYTNATLCASFQGYTGSAYYGYAERRFVKSTEDLQNFLADAGYAAERIYAEYQGTNPTHWANWVTSYSALFENDSPPLGGVALPAELLKPAFPWSGARTNIRAAVNSGTFLLTHRDHGNRSGWSKPVFTKTTDVDGLTNGILRPVVWSINCQTGWFDNETDDAAAGTSASDECFAEHWVRHASGGAIGVLAPTRTSYSYYNDRLFWGMADAVWTNFLEYHGVSYAAGSEPAYRLADILNRAKTYFLTKYSLSSTYTKCTMEIFHCLGDPTLEMWTGLPQDMTVAHTSRIPAGSAAVTVSVAQAGALVCCVYSNRILGAAESAGGVATVPLSPAPAGAGDLWITVTAHNYLPYLGTATVFQADADADGLPDEWEEDYLGSTGSAPEDDDDEDGLDNYGEWIGGFDPGDSNSVFSAGGEPAAEPGAYVLQWPSAADRYYSVYRATNLPGPFSLLSNGIAATPPVNVYTDAPAAELDPLFYRLVVATNAPP